MLQDEETCCTIETSFDIPLFEACREELVHIVGEEGYAQMEKHYASLLNSGPNPDLNPAMKS
jgi:hypothetical protein